MNNDCYVNIFISLVVIMTIAMGHCSYHEVEGKNPSVYSLLALLGVLAVGFLTLQFQKRPYYKRAVISAVPLALFFAVYLANIDLSNIMSREAFWILFVGSIVIYVASITPPKKLYRTIPLTLFFLYMMMLVSIVQKVHQPYYVLAFVSLCLLAKNV
jgi:hypothetical protein